MEENTKLTGFAEYQAMQERIDKLEKSLAHRDPVRELIEKWTFRAMSIVVGSGLVTGTAVMLARAIWRIWSWNR